MEIDYVVDWNLYDVISDNEVNYMISECNINRAEDIDIDFSMLSLKDEDEFLQKKCCLSWEQLKNLADSVNIILPSELKIEIFNCRIGELLNKLQFDHSVETIAEVVQADHIFSWCLLIIVKASSNAFKDVPYSEIAAKNAITILNFAKISFSGMNLSGIRIPNADLSNGIFDSTNFTYADLSGVNLQGSWLRNINLKRAILQKVTFGEKPFIQMTRNNGCKVPANIICYSKNGEWLAIASKSHIFLYNAHTNIKEKEIASGLTIESILFSPNSQYLVFSGERTNISECSLRIWNIQEDSIKCFVHKELHNKIVKIITFSNDEKYVLASREDSDIVIFSIQDAQLSL